MEPKNNRDSFSKINYQIHTFNQNSVEIRRLPFQLFHISTAKFSGPIAMYLNRHIHTDITFSNDQSDYILIFSNKGNIFNRIPFYMKDKILTFEFLPEQVLLVATASAYFIVDPFKSSINMIDMNQFFKNDKILGYKFFDSHLYVISKKGLFKIQNFYNPVPKLLSTPDINIENPVLLFSSQLNSQQPQVIYLSINKTIKSLKTKNQVLDYKLQDNKGKLMFLSKWSHHNNTYYLLVFHNPFKIAYYMNGNQNIYEPPTIKTFEQNPIPISTKKIDSKSNYGIVSNNGYSCGWVQDTVYLSNKLWVIRLNSNGLNVFRKQQTILCQQIDGIRLIGQNSQILRIIPPEYLSMFKQSGNISILELYSIFQQYEITNIVDIKTLQNNISNKDDNLETVLAATEFSLDPFQQMRMLKFGIFFKSYYGMRADLRQLCDELRIINNLKHQVGNRCLTLNQFRYLKTKKLDEFITILLRYNLHYIAYLIGGGQKVYIHWGKCIIQKQPQDNALKLIVNKFKDYKQKKSIQLSYLEIARYAIETKRFKLAQNLVQFQTILKNKIIILVWLANIKKESKYLEKALDNADRVRDSDVIFRVIIQVEKQNLMSDGIKKLIDKRIILNNHYIEYLRQKNQVKLKDYFLQKKLTFEIGLLGLKSYFQQTYKSSQSLENVKKLLPSITQSQLISKTSQYAMFLKKAMNSTYQINSSQIQKFKKQKNVEFLVQLLIERELLDQAVNVIFNIQSDIAYDMLMKIQKWRQTIVLARQRKNFEILNKLIERAPPSYRQQIASAFQKIRYQ